MRASGYFSCLVDRFVTPPFYACAKLRELASGVNRSQSAGETMGEMPCYEPSSLIQSIHKGVPFLTDREPGDSSSELVLNLGNGTRAFYDYFVVR